MAPEGPIALSNSINLLVSDTPGSSQTSGTFIQPGKNICLKGLRSAHIHQGVRNILRLHARLNYGSEVKVCVLTIYKVVGKT